MKIEQVTTDDGGVYECIAKNVLGETKHQFTVDVEGIVILLMMLFDICLVVEFHPSRQCYYSHSYQTVNQACQTCVIPGRTTTMLCSLPSI